MNYEALLARYENSSSPMAGPRAALWKEIFEQEHAEPPTEDVGIVLPSEAKVLQSEGSKRPSSRTESDPRGDALLARLESTTKAAPVAPAVLLNNKAAENDAAVVKAKDDLLNKRLAWLSSECPSTKQKMIKEKSDAEVQKKRADAMLERLTHVPAARILEKPPPVLKKNLNLAGKEEVFLSRLGDHRLQTKTKLWPWERELGDE